MKTDPPGDPRRIETLLAVMARLRGPEGCPWDRAQDFASIAPYTIEEAYEVAEAIARGDMAALREELGDLLLQAVFHARMAEEAGQFAFGDVVQAIVEKLIRRHPNVFGDAHTPTAAAQAAAWEDHKARERAARRGGTLDGVPEALPALMRAVKLQNRAARVGFDWRNSVEVLEKLREETAELMAEVKAGTADQDRVEDEFGDILFVCANLARHLGVDPESALRRTNAKFVRRFAEMEKRLAARGKRPEQSDLAEMDTLWTAIKTEEHGA